MSFADEVKAYKSSANKEPSTPKPAAQVPDISKEAAPQEPTPPPAPKHGEAYDGRLDVETLDFNSSLPAGNAPVDPAKAAAEAEKAKPAEAPAPAIDKKPAPIKIGKEEFQTIEEAVEYARQLQQAAAEDKAFAEGLKAAADKPAETVVEDSPYEKFSKKVFEDPTIAAQEFAEAIKAQIRDEYNQSLKLTAQQRAQQESQAQAWDNFSKENPDLSSTEIKSIMQDYLLPKFVKEGIIKPEDSFAKIAEETRKHLKIVKETARPEKIMPEGPAVLTGATSATVEATAAPKEEIVDMVTAMKRMRMKATSKKQ